MINPPKNHLQQSLVNDFIFWVLLVFFLPTAVNGQNRNTKWSLNQCVDHAVANNVSVKEGKLQTQINKNNLQSAQWDYAPNLSLGTNYAWNFGLNIDPVTNQISQERRQTANMQLSSNWVLFDGGRKFNSIDRANFNYLASLYEYEDLANNLKINVANSFLQILLNKEISSVAQEQLRITQFQVARMKDRVEAGASPEGDLLQLEAQEARDQQSLIAAQNAVQLSTIQLANLLQLTNPQDFDITEPDLMVPEPTVITKKADGIYEVAVENQPVIKGAELRIKSSEEAIKINQAGYLPSLSLIGQVGSSYSDQIPNVIGVSEVNVPIGQVESTGQLVTTIAPQQFPIVEGTKPFDNQVNDNLNQFIGINLTVPLFNRFAVKNAVQNARLQQEISALNLEQQKNNLRQTIYQAHADAKASYNSYLAAQKSTAASQKALDYAQERFKVGALNQVDFEQAKNNFISAKSQMIQSKYDYIFRIKVLEFYLTNQI